MSDTLIEAVARAYAERLECDWRSFVDEARAAIAAIEASGYDLVLRQHRDMGPGFTHHDSANCPCFAAAPKVAE